jgi:hypothetical protein
MRRKGLAQRFPALAQKISNGAQWVATARTRMSMARFMQEDRGRRRSLVSVLQRTCRHASYRMLRDFYRLVTHALTLRTGIGSLGRAPDR